MESGIDDSKLALQAKRKADNRKAFLKRCARPDAEAQRLKLRAKQRQQRRDRILLLKQDPVAWKAYQLKIHARNQAQKLKGNVSKYWKSPKGKALAAKEYQKKKADPGKLIQLRIGTRICQSMSMPIKECVAGSNRLAKYTEFKTSQEVKQYLESTFEDWMNWSNYGEHRLLGPRVWQVGHRIPLREYNCNDPKDLIRCWSKANLFAQEGKENIELNCTMPSSDVLIDMYDFWPLAWGGLPP